MHCGRISETYLISPERKSQREVCSLCVFPSSFQKGGFYSLHLQTSADAPLFSVFLQVDQQLRLSYNFSPEVEFRAVRSLILGKVRGLLFLSIPFQWALLKSMKK